MWHSLKNIWRLGVKELWSLWRDPVMLVLIVYTFTASVYTAATAMPDTLHKAPIAIVDEDQSPLSARITSAFYPPQFMPPQMVDFSHVDPGLDAGDFTFSLTIPPNFQRDVLAGRKAELQLNVDATRMSQAFSGSGYVQQIVLAEVNEFVQRHRGGSALPVDLELRARFNPGLNKLWFGGLMQIINNVSLNLVVRGALKVPIEGSLLLFMAGSALCLFATTAMGIFLATVARSMPQFGLLMVLTLLPLQLLSGGMTPRESMPQLVQDVMLFAPTTHFVELGQAILYRGAGIETVWKPFLWLAGIGAVLFWLSLMRFRKTLSSMA